MIVAIAVFFLVRALDDSLLLAGSLALFGRVLSILGGRTFGVIWLGRSCRGRGFFGCRTVFFSLLFVLKRGTAVFFEQPVLFHVSAAVSMDSSSVRN